MRTVDIVVLGAGPTGMGAAQRLAEQLDKSWLVIEAATEPRGAAGSWRDDKAFLWDTGGHVIHSHFRYFDKVINDAVTEWSYPVRNGAVWINEHIIDAPLQQHLDELDPGLAGKVSAELNKLLKQPEVTASNLADWFRSQFGESLTKAF